MNNLHRELAPMSDVAWAGMEAEARRTFCEHVAGRRVVDVTGPAGLELAAVGTGHVSDLPSSGSGVRMRRREAVPVVELHVPFTVSRQAVDEATRGAKNVNWQPAKDAARELAFAEDRIIVDGLAAAGIDGMRTVPTYPPLALPTEVSHYPATVANALSTLRLGGVAGPYRLLLSAEVHTVLTESADHGHPIRDHIERVLGDDGGIVWAPAIDGALVVSARGGDFELHLGQDASIGYLGHDSDTIELYIEESLTFQAHAAEATVSLGQLPLETNRCCDI